MHDIGLILTIAAGLSAALIFGIITHKLGLSPILGYLLAGIAVGPHTPGFVGDTHIAAQLAEIGVVLLMFGVGLHFHLKDLLAVRNVALPGAVVQSVVATALGIIAALGAGWGILAGAVLGMAISVASTVVLLRVLIDNNMLNTREGHVAVGWLVVEDVFTVLVLVLLPSFVHAMQSSTGAGSESIAWTLFLAMAKLTALVAIVLVAGGRVIPALLTWIARLRSRELFTLTVLVLALGIAVGSAKFFGASMALGAFLAGMVVSQSEVHHQAASDALPMRDAFAVLFFVSVGMLFDPRILLQQPGLVAVVLGIILLGKPLAALLIVLVLGHSVRTALTVAIGLAQIGEFSFILADLGRALKVLPTEGHSILVAAALISITLNPPLFRGLNRIEASLQRRPAVWRFLNRRSRDAQQAPVPTELLVESPAEVRAVVVGYGPVGRTLTRILADFRIRPVIIDLNVDTVKKLNASGHTAIYGDASSREILQAADIARARYLLVTLPDLAARFPVIATAKTINPELKVFTRARYLGERGMLEEAGASAIAYEEAEVAVSLAETLLNEVGATPASIDSEIARIRREITAPRTA
ncbi:MAG TPA: cation:proton antiporter [Planctomycetota bacterium]|nr:cation:proton antiporter [Planctomycetota bacterium]